ncbi:DUF4837 family protein [Christiangramia salexigens]|uniref:DUF4837 domain-containing protein n=1 Tax=Christiangramia salexigens TaxID=1913577 RepID=A0A1L3J6Q2_9FLAO|nr:DUF4837 family protein [Christiangramia salexigens]APG60806.1 DUF4837 domain-containing protein [Christiangramia salexigens]
MKRSLILLASIVFFISCKDDKGTKEKRILSDSSGNINQLTVVIENEKWEGEIGEVIRDHFAAPVDGLPQEEPLFSLSQIPPETFSGFVRNSRIFLKIETDSNKGLNILKDKFARPQTGIVVMGANSEEIVSVIQEKSDSIIGLLKKTELKEKQRRIGKSLKTDESLEEKFGVSLKFPSAYRFAKQEDDFVWIRKEIPKGNMEILVYEVPMSKIENDSSVIANITQMRDSIGKAQIPGPVEGSYMITEKAYAPYLFETTIDGKFTYETRGTWEVKNAFMAGPFVNYAIKDEANNRYIILEGFVFSPSRSKRDNVFELDAILQSARIK